MPPYPQRHAHRARSLHARVLALSIAVLAGREIAHAALGSWSSIGPEGATVNCIAIDPTNSSVGYVATFGGGLYKTTNAGASWSPSNNGLMVPGVPGDLPLWDLNVVAIDPGAPATLFAAGSSYLYKSVDAGATWSFVTTFPTSMSGPIRTITIDPGTPTRIFVGADRRIVRSIDGGATWVTSITFSTTRVTAIEVDPTNREVVYAGRRGGSLKSINGGVSWSALNVTAYDLTIDPANVQTLYAGNYGSGVRKSVDGGATWTPHNVGLDLTVRTVAADPSVSGTVYAGTDAGMFKSIDGAVSWTPSSTGLATGFIQTLTPVPGSPGVLYAGSMGAGVFKSTNSAASWTTVSSGIVATRVEALTASGNSLFAGIYGFGVSRKGLGGAWTTSAHGLVFPNFNDLAAAPSNPSVLLTAAWVGVFKSVDAGVTWASKNPNESQIFESVAIHPTNPSILYATSRPDLHTMVFKSVDGGDSWNPASSGLPEPVQNALFTIPALAIDPSSPETVYAATTQGVFKTITGGASWFPVNNGGPTSQTDVVAVDPKTPQTVYALGIGGLYKTTNGGAEWSLIHSFSSANSLAFSFSSLYVAGESGAWRSRDGGASWETINEGLTNTLVTSLAVDPGNSRRVFAGTAGAGVFSFDEPAPTLFYTVPPCRIIDTRNADGAWGGPALGAGTARTFAVSGQCGIPSTARAVASNLTVTGSDAPGHLTVWPADGVFPFSSVINFEAGKTRANNAILPLSETGEVSVYSGQASGGVHIILDVSGYFQ